MQAAINPKLISVSDLTLEDIPSILNYWYRSTPGFIESMGVDWSKMPTEDEFASGLRKKCIDNQSLPSSKLNALIVRYDQAGVGFHTINPLAEGEFGVFHAHFWDSKIRGRGLGLYTYATACHIFIERFGLKRILFKTPVQNVAALRVKEKLKIPYIGEEIINFGIYREGTVAKVFELLSDDARTKLAEFRVRQA